MISEFASYQRNRGSPDGYKGHKQDDEQVVVYICPVGHLKVVKKDALTEVVYLIPIILKIYMAARMRPRNDSSSRLLEFSFKSYSLGDIMASCTPAPFIEKLMLNVALTSSVYTSRSG